MRRKINLRVPETQLQKLLGFANEMLTMVEANLDESRPEEVRAAKEIRHVLNKVINMYKEQIDG